MCILVGTGMAATNEVSSVNIVGYINKSVDPGLAIGSPIFYQLSGTQTLNQVLGTNGVAADDPTLADNVYLYFPGIGYSNMFLYKGATPDPAYDYKWVDGVDVSTNIINPGQGFWIRNRGAGITTYTIMGQVVDLATNTMVIKPGLQILSYPYTCDRAITNLSLTNGVAADDPTLADNIYMYIPGVGYTNLFLYKGATPDPAYDYKWVDGVDVSTNVLKAGEGFWYRSRATTNSVWVEVRPYLN